MKFKPTPKKKVPEMLVAIKQLADAKAKHPNTSKVNQFISEATELIHHNEWGVALENILENLYELNYPLNEQIIKLAKEAFSACKMDYSEWQFIEELRK